MKGQFKNRVKELRTVRAGDLIPHSQNWRRHTTRQTEALKAILTEVGFAGAVLVRELDGGELQLLDGHLRAELDPNQEVPALVLDVDEAEARKLLAVFAVLMAHVKMFGALAAKPVLTFTQPRNRLP